MADDAEGFLRRPDRIGDDEDADDERRENLRNKHNWRFHSSIGLLVIALISLAVAVFIMHIFNNTWLGVIWMVASILAGYMGCCLCFRHSKEGQSLRTVNPNDVSLIEMQPIQHPPIVVSRQPTPERTRSSGVQNDPAPSQAEVRDLPVPGPSRSQPSAADAMIKRTHCPGEVASGSESQRAELQSALQDRAPVSSAAIKMSQASSSIARIAAESISSRTRSAAARNESCGDQQASGGSASPGATARWIEGRTLRQRKSTPDLRAASSDKEPTDD